VQNFRAWSPGMGPGGDLSCLGLEYFCFEGDGLWAAGDEALIALARREAAVMGLMDWSAMRGARVVRRRKALPIEDEACDEHLSIILLDLAAKFSTLHLAGRNGLHRTGGCDQATLSGLLAAETILAGEPAQHLRGVRRPGLKAA